MSTDWFDIANANITPLFKTKYRDFLDNRFNESTPLLNMIKRDTTMSGNSQRHLVKRADSGGFRAGGVPQASDSDYEQTNYTGLLAMAKGRIDLTTIDLSRDGGKGATGAFAKASAEVVLNLRAMFHRNMARMLMGDATAALGTIAGAGVTDNGGGSYTLEITDATFIRNHFRRSELLNVGTDTTSKFRVTSVSMLRDNKVTVLRLDGAVVPVAADILYRQDSKDLEWTGLANVLPATSGSLYGCTVGDGFQSIQHDADGAPLDAKTLIEVYYRIVEESDSAPKVLVMDYTQYIKLVKLGEDLKFILSDHSMTGPNNKLGNMPHVMIEGKNLPILVDTLCPPGVVMMLNTDRIVWESAGKGEFVKGDNGFLHYKGITGEDIYEMFYRTFGQFFIDPKSQGYIYDLSVEL